MLQLNLSDSMIWSGYSVVTYLLQLKDRHNGNILLDRDGHLVHIDFGFMLSNSPGNIGFEAAPFKLPLEYIEVLGGIDSAAYKEFRRLFKEGFEAARKHCDRIISEFTHRFYSISRVDSVRLLALVELMQKGQYISSYSLPLTHLSSSRLDSPLFCCSRRADCNPAAGPFPTRAYTTSGRRVCRTLDRHLAGEQLDSVVRFGEWHASSA